MDCQAKLLALHEEAGQYSPAAAVAQALMEHYEADKTQHLHYLCRTLDAQVRV